MEWDELWIRAIKLSFHKRWRELIGILRQTNVQRSEADIERVYVELEGLLEAECPDLVIKKSGGERFAERFG